MLGLDSSITKQVEKYSSRFYKVLRNSLKAKGEEILIVTDYGIKENVLASMMAYGYYHAAKKKGLPVNILFQGVKKGFMDADDHVVKAISKLENGQVTDVIETERSFHIFRLDGKVPTKYKELSEVRNEILNTLYRKEAEEKYKVWIEQLKQKAYISIK